MIINKKSAENKELNYTQLHRINAPSVQLDLLKLHEDSLNEKRMKKFLSIPLNNELVHKFLEYSMKYCNIS